MYSECLGERNRHLDWWKAFHTVMLPIVSVYQLCQQREMEREMLRYETVDFGVISQVEEKNVSTDTRAKKPFENMFFLRQEKITKHEAFKMK